MRQAGGTGRGCLTAKHGLVLRDLLSADLHFGRAEEKVCRIDEKS